MHNGGAFNRHSYHSRETGSKWFSSCYFRDYRRSSDVPYSYSGTCRLGENYGEKRNCYGDNYGENSQVNEREPSNHQ